MNPQEDPLRKLEESESPTVARLHAERPVPAPAFRGRLRRMLISPEGARRGSRFQFSIQGQIAGLLGAGTILLAIAAVGVAGAGPFGA